MPAPQRAVTIRPGARRKLRVTVLAGGPSAEREISLASGRAVADALRRAGHQVLLADISPDNLAALEHDADVVFPALHGIFGEDGTLQRIMEQRRIRFVGSGSRASALAMDKVAAKKAAAELGIPTPAYELVKPPAGPTLTPPVIVKPVAEGSSMATTIVRNRGSLRPAVESVAARYGCALVERFIPGDELTVGILGSQALPPICIRPSRDFYDYQAKYHDDRTEYLFEGGHSSAVLEQAAARSGGLFELLGCRHLARIDWIVDPDEKLWFLEVNTMPGFTSHSLVPKAAARAGIPFDQLVERLVSMAMETPA